jgi:hypothetical protein
VPSSPDHDGDLPFLPTPGQGFVRIERSWPGSTWAIASALLAAPQLAVIWLAGQKPRRDWTVVLPVLTGPLLLHPVSFGILGVSFLALGTFLLLRALRAAPRPSLTTGVA